MFSILNLFKLFVFKLNKCLPTKKVRIPIRIGNFESQFESQFESEFTASGKKRCSKNELIVDLVWFRVLTFKLMKYSQIQIWKTHVLLFAKWKICRSARALHFPIGQFWRSMRGENPVWHSKTAPRSRNVLTTRYCSAHKNLISINIVLSSTSYCSRQCSIFLWVRI